MKELFAPIILFCLLSFHWQRGEAADTATAIFNPQFRTLKVSAADNFMSPPLIRLGSDERIVISFDEIGEQNSWLQYRLIHCNADWQPSRLTDSEYIDGFNIGDIEDFAYSQNTFVHFTNYRLEIPNQDMQPLVSGNYLLQVFDRDDPDNIILQARFMVTEDAAGISGGVTSRTDRGFNTEWQQLDFAVSIPPEWRANPYQDVKVTIMQNGTESSRRSLSNPLRVENATLFFSHSPQLIYPAGNEYRRFETTSVTFPGMGADSVKYGGSNYHVWLKQDSPRALKNYEYDRTQHGRFLIREYNSTDSDLGADYVTVHFSLDLPYLRDADVFVDGEMTHNTFSDRNRMTYDAENRLYRLEMPLKQGAYNYRYVTLPRNSVSGPGTTHPEAVGASRPSSGSKHTKMSSSSDIETSVSVDMTEGNKYETGNEYWVAVYYHPPGARADRLIGFATIYN